MHSTSLPISLARLLSEWEPRLGRPNWYLTVIPALKACLRTLGQDPAELEIAKKHVYDFFETHLVSGDLALGHGQGFDDERRPIDTIVVHHTSNPPGMTRERLSAIELIRLYAPYFMNPSPPDGHLKGHPICSGHVREGRQVFWPYHWFIRRNGHCERLLNDDEVGWHAGNWDVNCRSVAVAFDNDYEWARPSARELRAFTELVIDNYPFIGTDRILGHREVISKTTCPSRIFLRSRSGTGWKEDLIGPLRKRAAA